VKAETIQALTPLFLGAIAVIFAPGMSDVSRAAGFGFANAAMPTAASYAGASGLAQNKNSDSNIQGSSVSIQKGDE
jgi:hypothetical protein